MLINLLYWAKQTQLDTSSTFGLQINAEKTVYWFMSMSSH